MTDGDGSNRCKKCVFREDHEFDVVLLLLSQLKMELPILMVAIECNIEPSSSVNAAICLPVLMNWVTFCVGSPINFCNSLKAVACIVMRSRSCTLGSKKERKLATNEMHVRNVSRGIIGYPCVEQNNERRKPRAGHDINVRGPLFDFRSSSGNG
jgi:hypothetical protein